MQKSSRAFAVVVFVGLLFPAAMVQAASQDRLVKTADAPEVYLVQNDRRIHIPSPSIFEAGGYTWGDIETISSIEMESIRNTALIKSPVSAKVYLITEGRKAWIPDEESFLSAGLDWNDIVLITQPQVEFYATAGFDAADAEAIAPVSSTQTTDAYTRPTILTIEDLGSLRTESPYAEATDLNIHGDVVGYSPVPDDTDSHPFLWKDGQIQELFNAPGIAKSINDNGQVVGFYRVGGDNGRTHAFLWEDGVRRDLGTLGSARVSREASDINNKGQIVGSAQMWMLDAPPVHGFLWENGTMRDIGSLGGDPAFVTTYPRAINDAGQIVGCSTDANGVEMPFLWENDVIKNLGSLYGLEGCAEDINSSGQVVGWSKKPDGSNEIFLWEDGVMKGLAEIESNWPASINNNGEIIANGEGGVLHWDDGVVTTILKDGDWNISDGQAINDHGQIVGFGKNLSLDGSRHAYILSFPETPAALYDVERYSTLPPSDEEDPCADCEEPEPEPSSSGGGSSGPTEPLSEPGDISEDENVIITDGEESVLDTSTSIYTFDDIILNVDEPQDS